MSAPLVSVICGYYNRPQLVRRTLDGIRAQSFKNFEVIIFDDKSTDETLDVIRSILDEYQDERFRLISHEKNMGFTRGLINAIKHARGKYIAVHDSGDYSLPRRLELQAAAMEKNPSVVVVGSHYINFIEHLNLARIRRPNSDSADFDSVCADSQFTHGEVMFRKAAYDKVGGYREQFKFSQDSDLWLRMIREGRFHTVPEVLYVRYIQFGGISYKPDTFVAQAAFYTLARVVARDKANESQWLRGLPENHVFKVLPMEDGRVQKVIVRGAFRGVIFGDFEQAIQVANGYIVSPVKRLQVKTLAHLGMTGLGAALLSVLRSKLGVFKATEAELLSISCGH